ncbi:lipoprotein NlpI [Vibrio sp. UCD-FRSSP16_10]|uniref:lipoprotein NlpI n=1 Tax=unclassified Vibrio TaxID=2614977 RepID=UPI0008002815|nr:MULTISPECIES: lipoprotein NlpI [unclassified Vibrio]OBT06618.1 lipoprotein NlpI [Vibrio sp. UCD-FRSSP16_30]OBT12315.1 lipoprotein NlpI [Vibrio sp. UCD-FRSSP16_10]
MKWFSVLIAGLVLTMSGCSSIGGKNEQWAPPPMAVPLQPSIQQEVQIARATQLLLRNDISNDERAELHFQRGVFYDGLGLRELARYDFNQSLSINPAQPEVFNLLGVYFTQIGQFDAAYEAFDSTLELDPNNQYAERNRAIALYYGDRNELALDEMIKHYNDDPSDPFRAMWLYIIEMKSDKANAKAQLEQRYAHKDDKWGWVLVSMMLEKVSNDEAFMQITAGAQDNLELAERLTEGYFYLAKRYQLQGNFSEAISLYKLSLSLNVYDYVEHRYAFLELGRIFTQLREERKQQQELEQQQLEQQ